MNDAIRDGLRALINAILDGAFELKVNNRSVIEVRLLTKAILCIPKLLVTNSGHDAQLIVNRALYSDKNDGAEDLITGLDLENGGLFNPPRRGSMMSTAKRQLIDAW
ncbi:T-complex protein 1 subunit zeta [Orchesella cincta]|uniref:T-complex protein 1 subunit zeta n=1 Tax=Orchesella cincta TaxID=48709 RepID=A0A1D2MU65_ORCCI|nr:T-complex protein 1 subunit zeta [Orchesella cincta]